MADETSAQSAPTVAAESAATVYGVADTAPAPGPTLAAGALVDHFRVVRLLGRGGMGEVYLARDTKLGRKIALKVVRPRFVAERTLARFLEEARTTARFAHPHIVAIHAVGTHEERPYVALEYLEGDNLRERMREEAPTLRDALRVARAVADALAEAHANGVLHRDLKPENVVWPVDGRIRVVDFGLAGRVESLSSGAPVEGTPQYMAPEQWRSEALSPATDVWALGVVLFELCAGRRPYAGDQAAALASEVCSPEPAPRLREGEARFELPTELVELVEGCLAKAPEERPSAEEVRARLDRILARRPGEEDEETPPFPGLHAYRERHAGLFHGRDDAIAEAMERLRDAPVLPIVGPSGSGKSSFVGAGLVPRLRERSAWTVLRLRPGSAPFTTLADRLIGGHSQTSSQRADSSERALQREQERDELATLLREAPRTLALMLHDLADDTGGRVLLVVDQLEEVFTLTPDPATRAAFVDALCHAAGDAAEPVRVAFCIRDDFLGRLSAEPSARHALRDVMVLGRPTDESLREILVAPLAARGYAYEDPELPERMIAAVRAEQTCLPLLAFTGRKLWELRDRETRTIPSAAYETIGGVAGALAQHADGVLEGLSADEVLVARELLLRLVTPEGTRRVVPRDKVLEDLPEGGEALLDRLVDARLLALRRRSGLPARVELVHEALISRWGQLAGWLEASREDLKAVRELERAASLWDARGRRKEEVWQGEALYEARRTLRRAEEGRPAASRLARAFVDAAERRARRSRRTRRLLIGGAFVVLAGVTLAITVQSWEVAEQRDEAERRRVLADQRGAEALRESARTALTEGRLLEARAKLRGSLELEDSLAARALWTRAAAHPRHWQLDFGAFVRGVAISPDGTTVAAGGDDGAVYLIDMETADRRVLGRHEDWVWALAFSPDGQQLATGSQDGVIKLWDLKLGRPSELIGHDNAAWYLAFSPDGTRLASAGADRLVHVWDVAGGERLASLGRPEHGAICAAWTPGGGRLAICTAELGGVGIWDVERSELVRVVDTKRESISVVAFTPDGRRLVGAGEDFRVHVWETEGWTQLHRLEGHKAPCFRLALDRQGRFAVVGDYAGGVLVWDLQEGSLSHRLESHGAPVGGLALGPHGRVATASYDMILRVSRLERAAPAATHHPGRYLFDVAFSPDGTKLVTGGFGGAALWDAETGRRLGRLGADTDAVMGVDWSPDGKRIATGDADGRARIFDVGRGTARHTLSHWGMVDHVRFASGGEHLITTSWDGFARIFDVSSGERLHRHGGEGAVHDALIDDGGAVLYAAVRDGSLRTFPLADGAAPHEPRWGHRGILTGLAKDAQGALYSSSEDGTVRRWPAGGPPETVFERPGGRVERIDLHPSQPLMAIPTDAGALLLNLESGEQVPLRGHRGGVMSARFSPDGTRVATAGADGTVRLFDSRTGAPHWLTPTAPEASVGDSEQTLSGPIHGQDVVGYRDGRVLVSGGASMLETPASPVTALGAGPAGTLLVGHEDGHAGIWDLATGTRLDGRRLHGPVIQARTDGDRAALESELGDRFERDLRGLTQSHCELLTEVWAEVPVVWRAGRPEASPPDPAHPCAAGGL